MSSFTSDELALVTASREQYRGKDYIRLSFSYDPAIIEKIKKVRGRAWSATYRSWFVPDTIVNRETFKVSGHDEISTDLLQAVKNKIELKAYSANTMKSYLHHCRTFLSQVPSGVDPRELSKDFIEEYLLERQRKNKTSESDTNAHINAIKFLYEQVLGRDRMLFYLPRPQKPLKLPKVLGEHELERLFRAVPNLKHKTILLTAFSCGLRVGEVIRLKHTDIDYERHQLFIERSKGKKDRYVGLSPILSDVLKKYITLYPTSYSYLFEGQIAGEHYSARSAQTIFNRAIKAAGIGKKVTFHALRHSFATHLLEKGVDIKYIKDLLGHFDIKTTERYLHVAREKLVEIKSPLDYLDVDI